MRFDIYATGQYRENYGDATRPYWKNKGSDLQIITSDVGIDTLTEARGEAEKRVHAGEFDYATDGSACHFDSIILFPAGAGEQLRSLIENEVSIEDAPSYCWGTNWKEVVEQYREWLNYFGEQLPVES